MYKNSKMHIILMRSKVTFQQESQYCCFLSAVHDLVNHTDHKVSSDSQKFNKITSKTASLFFCLKVLGPAFFKKVLFSTEKRGSPPGYFKRALT